MSAVVRRSLRHLCRIKADVECLGGAGGVAALVVLRLVLAAQVALPGLVPGLACLGLYLLGACV